MEPKELEMDIPIKCGLAHEFNNQLTVIMAHCDFLAEHCSASQTALNHLGMIVASARRMGSALRSHECEMNELMQVNQRKQPQAVAGFERKAIAAK
jgi:hypothetical protein